MPQDSQDGRLNNQNNPESTENRLIDDLEIVPGIATGTGKRSLVLLTQCGQLVVDINMRYLRPMLVLSRALRAELAAPALVDHHRGRLTAAEIARRLGADPDGFEVERTTVIAYISGIRKAIAKAATKAGMPAPQIIDSGYGCYRLVRPFSPTCDPPLNRAIA